MTNESSESSVRPTLLSPISGAPNWKTKMQNEMSEIVTIKEAWDILPSSVWCLGDFHLLILRPMFWPQKIWSFLASYFMPFLYSSELWLAEEKKRKHDETNLARSFNHAFFSNLVFFTPWVVFCFSYLRDFQVLDSSRDANDLFFWRRWSVVWRSLQPIQLGWSFVAVRSCFSSSIDFSEKSKIR